MTPSISSGVTGLKPSWKIRRISNRQSPCQT
ncbi:ribonuclease P 21 subunit (human), isoform CRA_a [Rattus norvegicus]|uniref:Ribonuclease P 21 subunit (Human), isoform CRA_a n=1 Tax=Rattus norvegicus TaxID=10116 RepID=A6KRA1_RAT|nr:ribonuclease P 21 subunit (human), isoform CRA_a [Rattus norvegicus]